MNIHIWFLAPMIFFWISVNYLFIGYAINVNSFYPITTITSIILAVVFTKLTFREDVKQKGDEK